MKNLFNDTKVAIGGLQKIKFYHRALKQILLSYILQLIVLVLIVIGIINGEDKMIILFSTVLICIGFTFTSFLFTMILICCYRLEIIYEKTIKDFGEKSINFQAWYKKWYGDPTKSLMETMEENGCF
jgi:hypothetical protein